MHAHSPTSVDSEGGAPTPHLISLFTNEHSAFLKTREPVWRHDGDHSPMSVVSPDILFLSRAPLRHCVLLSCLFRLL